MKSFCGGSRGAVFSKRAPLVAEGKNLMDMGLTFIGKWIKIKLKK
jgi:hypothetical protein